MNAIESIHVAPSGEVRPAPGRFEQTLRGAAAGLAGGLAAGLGLAAPLAPAGTVLSAAIRTAAASAALSGLPGLAASPPVPGPRTGAEPTPGGAGAADPLATVRALQAQSQSFNLQYLQLQEVMQRESRAFGAVSNVLKLRHDSARAAIQNIH